MSVPNKNDIFGINTSRQIDWYIKIDIFRLRYRMVIKQLIKARKTLNRELKEKFLEADFYYRIKYNKIVKLKKLKEKNEPYNVDKITKININQMIQKEKTKLYHTNFLVSNETKALFKSNIKNETNSDFSKRLNIIETNQVVQLKH